MIPLLCKLHNARADVIRVRVGDPPAFGDQLHRGFGLVALGDEDTRTHRRSAVTSIRAMDIHLAARPDRFERSLCPQDQLGDRNGKEGTIDRPQPEQSHRRLMRVGIRTAAEAHIDDEPYPQLAQAVIVACQRRRADEQFIGNV